MPIRAAPAPSAVLWSSLPGCVGCFAHQGFGPRVCFLTPPSGLSRSSGRGPGRERRGGGYHPGNELAETMRDPFFPEPTLSSHRVCSHFIWCQLTFAENRPRTPASMKMGCEQDRVPVLELLLLEGPASKQCPVESLQMLTLTKVDMERVVGTMKVQFILS